MINHPVCDLTGLILDDRSVTIEVDNERIIMRRLEPADYARAYGGEIVPMFVNMDVAIRSPLVHALRSTDGGN